MRFSNFIFNLIGVILLFTLLFVTIEYPIVYIVGLIVYFHIIWIEDSLVKLLEETRRRK